MSPAPLSKAITDLEDYWAHPTTRSGLECNHYQTTSRPFLNGRLRTCAPSSTGWMKLVSTSWPRHSYTTQRTVFQASPPLLATLQADKAAKRALQHPYFAQTA